MPLSDILPPGVRDRLAQQFGPSEKDNLCDIYRKTARTRDGAMSSDGTMVRIAHNLPVQIVNVENQYVAEKVIGAQVGREMQFLMHLPRFTDVVDEDEIRLAWPIWDDVEYLYEGDQRIPSTSNGYSYRSRTTGLTGSVEPTWPTSYVEGQASLWRPTKAYALNTLLKPAGAERIVYKATTGGTSGASEPVWPTTVSGTVTDGSVVWTAMSLVADGDITWQLWGPYEVYDVISVRAPQTIEITRECYVRRRV